MLRKSLMSTALGLFLAIGASNAQVIAVQVAPPRPLVERRVPTPGPGYVLTPGYHRWDGRAYVWTPGRGFCLRVRTPIGWLTAGYTATAATSKSKATGGNLVTPAA